MKFIVDVARFMQSIACLFKIAEMDEDMMQNTFLACILTGKLQKEKKSFAFMNFIFPEHELESKQHLE